MDRRSWGIVLLTAVIVAAIVVPAWGGRRVTGTARLAPPQDPPQVGDCLDEMPSSRSALDFLPPLMTARTGTCGEQNVGEIVFVANDVDGFPRSMQNTMSRPEPLACEPLMRDYIGVPQGIADQATGVLWRSWDTLTTALIGPDLQQYFAGQRWVACVVYPEFTPYQGSLDGSVHSGRGANSFATCLLLNADPDDDAGSCAKPHHTELFGWVRFAAADTTTDAACAELVQRITGMQDPTASGQLAVKVRSAGEVGPATSVDTPPSVNHVSCSVTTVDQRALTGTLIGWGDKPLPWS